MWKNITRVYLIVLGLPKSIVFNFYYLPFEQAIKLPIFVSHRVWLRRLSGKVNISHAQFGLVQIGFGDIGIFDQKKSRTIWDVAGCVEFKGKTRIGHGSKISVEGRLEVGSDFYISAESTIIANEHITIGEQVLISWDVLIMDTDMHEIFDMSGGTTKVSSPIVIGSNVWICCRSMLLKGVKVVDGVVIAASSNVTKSALVKNSLVGGNPAKLIKENIKWKM